MAETEVEITAGDDKSLLQGALTDTAPAGDTGSDQEQPKEVKEDATGRLHGEGGKFVPKDKPEPEKPIPAQAAPEKPGEQKTDQDGQIPSWRHREEAEARRAAERRADEAERTAADFRRRLDELQRAQQKPAEIPDPLENPDGYRQHFEQTFDQKLRNLEANFSFRSAHREHKETFEKAYTDMVNRAERGDPSIVRSVMGSSDPGEALVRWYRREQTLSEVGEDPAAYKARVLEEAMKDPAFQSRVIEAVKNANGATRPAQVTQLPPSLARAAGSAVNDASDYDDSDAGLLKSALRR